MNYLQLGIIAPPPNANAREVFHVRTYTRNTSQHTRTRTTYKIRVVHVDSNKVELY